MLSVGCWGPFCFRTPQQGTLGKTDFLRAPHFVASNQKRRPVRALRSRSVVVDGSLRIPYVEIETNQQLFGGRDLESDSTIPLLDLKVADSSLPYEYPNFRLRFSPQTLKLAGNKERRVSREGGLLNRMFGGSATPAKDDEQAIATPTSPSLPKDKQTGSSNMSLPRDQRDGAKGEKRGSMGLNSGQKSNEEGSQGGDGQRRKSSIAKASALFTTAKNSLHLSHNSQSALSELPQSPQQTSLQRLGKTDAALSVPQGSLNNSAGESHPTARSSFRVGVTEDKNKKCRRTMEDTHAYLYNFLGTPAPVLASDTAGKKSEDKADSASDGTLASDVIETDNGYFAVFDGHAGTFAADWCGKKLHVILEEIIRSNPNSAIPELLDQTFTSCDRQLEKLPLKNSGCTAICAVLRWEDRIPNSSSATGSTSIAPIAAAVIKAQENSAESGNLASLIPPSIQAAPPTVTSATAIPKLQESASRQRVLYTANVGDARIVLCRNGKALRLSYDHKGSDENEGKRITNAGGLILNNRVNGVLAVTRALGDTYMKDLVTGHPYTTETVIQPDMDEFLILACDGLWDVCSDQDAVDLIRKIEDPQLASKKLVDHALSRFSTDNLSCMVVRFDANAIKQTVGNKADPIGVEGDPPGKGGISEADAIVKEARKSMIDGQFDGSTIGSSSSEGEKRKTSQEVIMEEGDKESGPELDADSTKKILTAKSST